MSLRKIIDWEIAKADGALYGTIASDFYQYYDIAGQWTWACDVDLGNDTNGENVLRNVPVATNCREIIYAQTGMPVALQQQGQNKYAIVGLSKKCQSTLHIIYMDFTDSFGSVINTVIVGNLYRPLTYGELGTSLVGFGYGSLPYGARGKFDIDGHLIEILRSY